MLDFFHKMPSVKLSNKDKMNPHGKMIVDIIEKEDKIAEFIKLWRTNFLKGSNPKYLP